MSWVSTSYESVGRARQKQRTRDLLVAAARDLVAAGVAPTVEQAAAAAGLSRPTAYRYFANQRALLAAAHPETIAATLLPADPPEDPALRLELVIKALTDVIVDTEEQQRTMLRLSLESDPAERASLPLRQGRAIGWIEDALSPLGADQLSADARLQLVLAIRSAVGIEALVWLTDVAMLSRTDAVSLMRWSAQALLHSAIAGRPPEPAAGRPAGVRIDS